MSRSVYARACSYAYKLVGNEYKDLVHRAWIDTRKWQRVDMLTKPMPHVCRDIKQAWYRSLVKKYWMNGSRWKSGERQLRYQLVRDVQEDLYSRESSIQLAMEAKELYDNIYDRIEDHSPNTRENLKTYLLLKQEGYKQYEIAEVLGITCADYYRNKLIKIAEECLKLGNG